MENKNLIAYYRIFGLYDTVLDEEDVQRRRVSHWCHKYGFEVKSEFVDISSRDNLKEAFLQACEEGSCVIVASICRLADTPKEYLSLRNNKNASFVSAEFDDMCFINKPVGELAAHMDLITTLLMGTREKYLEDCRKFVL